MKILQIITAVLLLPLTFIGSQAYAEDGRGCPVFNASMVDAAMLATEYSQSEPVFGWAEDSPKDAYIYCLWSAEPGSIFFVRVGICEEACGSGDGKGEGHLMGKSPDGTNPSPDYHTLLRTRVFNLSPAQQHACRAQVLQSFVWKQYCKPLLP